MKCGHIDERYSYQIELVWWRGSTGRYFYCGLEHSFTYSR